MKLGSMFAQTIRSSGSMTSMKWKLQIECTHEKMSPRWRDNLRFINAKIAVIDPELVMVCENIETRFIGCLSLQSLSLLKNDSIIIPFNSSTMVWRWMLRWTKIKLNHLLLPKRPFLSAFAEHSSKIKKSLITIRKKNTKCKNVKIVTLKANMFNI